MALYYGGSNSNTKVVRTPDGWLVTHWVGGATGVSVHSIEVADPQHEIRPAEFKLAGEASKGRAGK